MKSEAHIMQFQCPWNRAYIINKEDLFYEAGYMEMQKQQGLIECRKTFFDGHLKVIYFTDGYMSVSDFLKKKRYEEIIYLLESIIDTAELIQSQKYLSLQNILTEEDSIFVDRDTNKIQLIYFPLKFSSEEDESCNVVTVLFENIIKTACSTDNLSENEKQRLYSFCINHPHSISEMKKVLYSIKNEKKSTLPEDKNEFFYHAGDL